MRILIADDDRVSRHLLQTTLQKWGYEVVTASDGLEVWDILQQKGSPELVILDWMMPGMNGVEICKKIRAEKKDTYTYILLLTGKDKKKDLIEGLNSGADDYLTKPFYPQELEVRLRTGRRILNLQSQLLGVQDILRQQATHDPLTGLSNRRAILEVLQKKFEDCNEMKTGLGILLMDLDHFKMINDTHGHVVGDLVLQEVSRRLLGCTSQADTIGRYGGEEFLGVIPDLNPTRVYSLAVSIKEAVSVLPISFDQLSFPVTISIGVANLELHPANILSFIHGADMALYRAKKGGRNRIEVATKDDLM